MKGKTPARFEEPTERQREFLETVRQLTLELRRPPTSGEIALRLGTTRFGASKQLQALEAKGFVEDAPLEVRSGRWRLTRRARTER